VGVGLDRVSESSVGVGELTARGRSVGDGSGVHDGPGLRLAVAVGVRLGVGVHVCGPELTVVGVREG
jgi:hypothetical protein